MFVGDEIVVCYGNRYAPDQFEAEIPESLAPCHLVAAGGLASHVLSQHRRMKPATAIEPIGLLGYDDQRRANLVDWAIQPAAFKGDQPWTLAMAGTSMNSGKTTAAAHLIRGLVLSGLRVGAAKITGTGAGGDVWLMRDAGANPVLDFTSVGFPSTYRATAQDVEHIMHTLISHLAAAGVDAIILEIADGIFQDETNNLLTSDAFRTAVHGIIFASPGALSASGGVTWLREHELPVLAVSGVVTSSPLSTREAEKVTDLPVLDLEDLRNPKTAASLRSRSSLLLSQQPISQCA